MSRAKALAGFFLALLPLCAFAIDAGYNCNCDDEGFWSAQRILECQKVSDFLIAVAYFSIPIELLYFVSFSDVPFKWVLVQFIAFIVLCGLTHLLNGWTYYGPHSFQLMLSLTIAKLLTALVSCATAITLLTLIPILLKAKVRELFLRQNVLELDQEVEMMKRQKEAGLHVRMLTREIRKSLDKHTILYTTLVELSKTLDLHNCIVWMPNESRSEMIMTHELKAGSLRNYGRSVPIDDPDVKEIRETKGVRILRPESALAAASGNGLDELGPIAAVRMPMLRASNFKGGTPESVDTHYAILVLVLPFANFRHWSYHEMEIVEVVADQVAVALSHAAVLEESQLMREKLAEQNRTLQHAKRNAMMASQARDSFQKVMSHGMRKPMHSIVGLLSILEGESLNSDQKLLVGTMSKTSHVLSTLISDVMEISAKVDGKFPLEIRRFHLHSMIKEASCLAKCLCILKGFGFEIEVQSSLPDLVMGEENRTFQVILHVVGYLLDSYNGVGTVKLRILQESRIDGKNNEKSWGGALMMMSSEFVHVKLEAEISGGGPESSSIVPSDRPAITTSHGNNDTSALSFSVCKKIVQMMQGSIWIASRPQGLPQRMTLVLRFQLLSSWGEAASLFHGDTHLTQFTGLRVLLADDDSVNKAVTKKLLEKLGCQVTTVSSGMECLAALTRAENSYRVVLLDLHMHDIDGFDVTMRIRKFRSQSRPLIVALTVNAEERIWERCLLAGMNGVIWKPIVLQGLSDELRRVLQRAGDVV
ncbi:hypothetical protein MLD38_023665 [Melastoma candidum]|uniref:Uncharacterized protein n=2 Tax=Melastoma candidum TaxID=119954 RepID=A0ACB9NWI9_9MYRT|nr:hypothetical protein MLD38_023665 [Melastoma candidum]